MNTYALGFAFLKEEHFTKVILIKKNKPDFMKGKLNGIGGKLEHSELPRKCMMREFTEETGITDYINWDSRGAINFGNAIVHVYSCFLNRDVFYKARTTEKEEIKFRTVNNFLWRDCVYNLSWLIPLLLDIDCMHFNIYNTNGELANLRQKDFENKTGD